MEKGVRPHRMLEYVQERPLVAFSDAYSAKVAGVVGLVHIICGLVALTANIVGIMFGANIPLAAGVWSSIFFVSSGSLALAGACIKTKRLVVSTLVMAILSCLAAVLLLLIASFTLMEDINSSMSSSSIWQELETGSSYTPSITVHSNMTSLRNNDLLRERAVHRLRTGVYATELAVGLLMLVAATLSSALTCHPLCCRGCRSKTLSKDSERSMSLPEGARLTVPPELPPPYEAKTL